MTESLTQIETKIFKIIEEADYDKTLHVIQAPAACGKTFIANFYHLKTKDCLLNPRNLPHCYIYGLIIIDGGNSWLSLRDEIIYWAGIAEETKSGFVAFYNEPIEVEGKSIFFLKNHKINA